MEHKRKTTLNDTTTTPGHTVIHFTSDPALIINLVMSKSRTVEKNVSPNTQNAVFTQCDVKSLRTGLEVVVLEVLFLFLVTNVSLSTCPSALTQNSFSNE